MIFDAHLDLALNAIEWNRDLTQPLAELRRREANMTDKPDRGHGTVSLPEMRRGGVGLCVATQLARVEHNAYSPIFGWRSPAQAWAMTQGQLAWYGAMEAAGEMVQIRDRAGLERHLALWEVENVERRTPNAEHRTAELPIGYILSLEGADSLVTPQYLERAFASGLRAIGPAHYGPGVYANGTDASGGLNEQGRELLREAGRLGLILDVTHLCDETFWEALERFHGPLWASHQNVRALVPHMRQFSDEQLRALIARGAVIGAALDAWMLFPGWVRGKTTPQSSGVRLEHVANHIDHVCQLAGNARHAGIGSDLDGAFGNEQTPQDLDTIADLDKLRGILATRDYSAEDIEGICWRNFVTLLRAAWK
ncbi:MAG: rane dipeptidase [Chthoniobacter sp.]|jgi:membrane dipeptidase|nr:rane dipeptidase [Chthoniobacter sp.]